MRIGGRKAIPLVALLLICLAQQACTGSLYKKSAETFGKAASSTASGYQTIVKEYESSQLTAKARSVMGSTISSEDSLTRELAYDAAQDVEARLSLVKALTKYSDALVALASMGSAKEASDSLKGLGTQLESSGSDKAKTWGGIVGQLAQLLLDKRVKKSVGQAIVDADPAIQQVSSILKVELGQMKPLLELESVTEWNRMRADLSKLSAEGGDGSTESTFLLLAMQENLKKRREFDKIFTDTTQAIDKMSSAHATLARQATGRDRDALLKDIQSFVAAANSLADSIKDI
jgi:hypothetical protein